MKDRSKAKHQRQRKPQHTDGHCDHIEAELEAPGSLLARRSDATLQRGGSRLGSAPLLGHPLIIALCPNDFCHSPDRIRQRPRSVKARNSRNSTHTIGAGDQR